jgi:hypothetical protein
MNAGLENDRFTRSADWEREIRLPEYRPKFPFWAMGATGLEPVTSCV